MHANVSTIAIFDDYNQSIKFNTVEHRALPHLFENTFPPHYDYEYSINLWIAVDIKKRSLPLHGPGKTMANTHLLSLYKLWSCAIR